MYDISSSDFDGKFEEYLINQSYDNCKLVKLANGFEKSKSGKCKNELIWDMPDNFFIFASAIDINDLYEIENIVNCFLNNRNIALTVRLDSVNNKKMDDEKTLTRQGILDFLSQNLQQKIIIQASSFKLLAGYKSVLKSANWYKNQFCYYEDLNLIYRILVKNDIEIKIINKDINVINIGIKSSELIECIRRFELIEPDKTLRSICNQLYRKIHK